MMSRVCVVGSINMDLVVRSERIPVGGETILGGEFRSIPGGKGANQAVAARRLGAEVDMVGCIGDDPFGKELKEGLVREGIGVEFVREVDGSSGVALITVSDEGENSIVVSPGANGLVSIGMVREAREVIARADIVLVQLEIPLEAVRETIKIANESGVRVILNPAPARDVGDLDVFMVTPNETEGRLLVGGSVASPLSIEEIIRGLRADYVIVTRGKEGVSFGINGDIKEMGAYPVRVVDSTAAGDAFNGGLAVGIAEGMEIEDAIRFGQKAAGIAVGRFGAQPSLPFRDEVERFGEK